MLGALGSVVHPKVHLQATATSLLVYVGSVELLYVFNYFDPQQISVENTGALNNEGDKNDANGGSEYLMTRKKPLKLK